MRWFSVMILGIDASRANHEHKTGVEWYSFHIIEALKRVVPKDVHVRLYADTKLSGPLGDLPDNWTEKVLSWPPRRLWTHLRLSTEMVQSPPDVLFVPAHVPPLIHPPRTVMTVHDVAAARFPETYSAFERRYSLAAARYAVRRLWRIVTPSEFTKKELLDLFAERRADSLQPDRDNIFVVPHGYDRRYDMPGAQTEIRRVLSVYGIYPPYLLSVGRLERKKNTVATVRAFTQIQDRLPGENLHLVLVGSPGYGYEEVVSAIAESPYRDRIATPGWVGAENLAALYQGAAAVLFPSLYEGFGLPLLEAMASGTPVIAGAGSSLEEVGGAAALYVAPGDPAALCAAGVRLLTDAAFNRLCRERGLAHARQFSWDRAARHTWQVLAA
ncbi:MAG: Glycosyl transferase group 1 [Candidatus Magasanikbacteria bacterium GW2011_GWA2_56_11]|uniref:Glycosyl transferase group 1 n=1 Tax=Candidatus Magasanikbacteria bacterium GW2011_GWA2_56_11 TaxID=1619044 RepID=A0A0G1YIG1_9BACT|nr:MAG: Glycosyl transferase group 1 [Candidatus Magasanikbacteria bacterium GW2011_GWA2_56_11]